MTMQTAPNAGIPSMATDPPVSERQRRAMYAALHGRSTLGIPKSVAEKFVGSGHDMEPGDWDQLIEGIGKLHKFLEEERSEPEHAGDDDPSRAAGVALREPEGRMLFVKRAGSGDHVGEWAFPGGYVKGDENEEAAAIRELEEELGFILRQPLRVRYDSTDNGLTYSTFVHDVEGQFAPELNSESSDYMWAAPDKAPQPLHPGAQKVLGDISVATPNVTEPSPAQDSKRLQTEVNYSPSISRDTCALCEHYANNCCALVEGTIDPGYWCELFEARGDMAADHYAFDKSSVRNLDGNGNLHVAVTNISKANVCPYLGSEIPDWQRLGLQPDKIYQLLRDPEELRKAAKTFNNVQLLSEHSPVSAADHQPDLVIGSTGTDAEFVYPYLKNSLVVWDADYIRAIGSGDQKELSSAYRYRADMTPGTFQGARYDGVMRDIVGNHVALVKEGRAGTDVVVGDSKPAAPANNEQRKVTMNTANLSKTAAFVGGALTAFLLPKLAQDAKLPDIRPALDGVTAKNLDEKRPQIVEGIKSAFKNVPLAKNMALDDIPDFVKNLKAEDEEEDDDDDEKKKAAVAGDDPPEFEGKPVKDAEPPEVTRAAMDEAIKVAADNATKKAVEQQRETRDAEKFVRPFVGELAITYDSAEQVHRAAAKILGIEGADTVHKDALPALIKVTGARKTETASQSSAVAMDASTLSDFHERFPGAARIGHLG